ncbi:hypothetical protein TNCV_157791 [Trichonephila clavipes]|nr:hypothetical protein TNCV_157791 [Trichonephila clavipes]
MWIQYGNTVLDLNGALSLATEKTGFMDREATSRVKNWGRLQDNKCLREKFNGFCYSMDSARRPWLRLLLTLHHTQKRLQWFDLR